MGLEILAFESPTLDLDITLVIQVCIYFLLFLALRKFILVPYFRAFDKREALTTGAQEEAAKLKQEAEAAQANYDSERQKTYGEAESVRREEVAKANAEASKIVEAARREIQLDIARRQADLEQQLATARRNADPEIDAISAQIAQKILV